MLVRAELESGGRQSIRVDCGPADNSNTLDQLDVDEALADDDGDDDDESYSEQGGHRHDQMTTTSSYGQVTESTERTMTSHNWKSVTSLVPADETSAAMTTASVTSSHYVTSDYSTSSSLNHSCELLSVLLTRSR